MENDTAIDTVTGPGWLRGIERTVTGLGYELVEVERAARGLLRVTIDRVPGRSYPLRGADDGAGVVATDGGEFVTVEDCERVTRQLQYALEVDGVPYERLEVSSPGLDRLLKHEADFARFAGSQVNLTLKQPFQGRKHWKGTLLAQPPEAQGGWRLVLDDGQGRAARRAKAAKAAKEGPAPPGDGPQALDFRLDEVREARLVPVVDFKGRGRDVAVAGKSESKGGANGAPADGGLER